MSVSEEAIPLCPTCRSADVVPFLYGLPTGDGFAMAQHCEVRLGGCMVSYDSPRWTCQACGHAFGEMWPKLEATSETTD